MQSEESGDGCGRDRSEMRARNGKRSGRTDVDDTREHSGVVWERCEVSERCTPRCEMKEKNAERCLIERGRSPVLFYTICY